MRAGCGSWSGNETLHSSGLVMEEKLWRVFPCKMKRWQPGDGWVGELAEDLARTLSVMLLTLAEFEYAMSLVCGDFTSALVKHDPGAGMNRMNSGGGLGLRIEGQISGLIKEVQEAGLWFPS